MSSCCISKTRKAKKKHKCCECNSEIQPNEYYQYTSGVWDGEPDSYKQCMLCHQLSQGALLLVDYHDEELCFEQLREFLLEDFCTGANPVDYVSELSSRMKVSVENINRLLKLY